MVFDKWGNSIAVRIPKSFADELKIKSGRHGLLMKEDDSIKILPA